MVQVLTDGAFDAFVQETDGLLVLDLYADWCEPCRKLAPIFAELAEEYGGDATFAKVDIESNPETKEAVGVKFLPTVALLREGRVVEIVAGARPKTFLTQRIEEHI